MRVVVSYDRTSRVGVRARIGSSVGPAGSMIRRDPELSWQPFVVCHMVACQGGSGISSGVNSGPRHCECERVPSLIFVGERTYE